MSPGGWENVASARSRPLPLCSNVLQGTEKFPCGFRYLVKRSDYLTRISKIAIFSDIQIIKEMRSQFIRNSLLSKRLQKQNFYFWGSRPYFLIHFLPPEDFKNKHVRGSKTKRNNNSTSSLRTADAFLVVASLPPKTAIFSEGEKRRPEMRLLFAG